MCNGCLEAYSFYFPVSLFAPGGGYYQTNLELGVSNKLMVIPNLYAGIVDSPGKLVALLEADNLAQTQISLDVLAS